MIEIKEDQTTITKDEKIKITQHCRFVIDTYGDKVLRLKQELAELQQERSDAQYLLHKVNSLEVV